MERPAKRAKLLPDERASDDTDTENSGKLRSGAYEPENVGDEEGFTFKVNEEYARRFEHNKKRAERHRLEEKYSRSKTKPLRSAANEGESASLDGSSSESESEDDNAMLATEALDAEIFATLHAIKSKDPRVYDKSSTFYTENDADAPTTARKEDKPMYLRDYHRKNLLETRKEDTEMEEGVAVPTYAEEQDALKRRIVEEMHAATGAGGVEQGNGGADSEDEEGFLVAKQLPRLQTQDLRRPTKPMLVPPSAADENPDNFLTGFMAARAWIPDATSRFQPFESDDEEEERRAEVFEEAYNMRFEDPHRANEKLMSHSREAAAKYSVRREEVSGRKKIREGHRAKKDAERMEREQERARLRRLKVEEAEEKVRKIKDAAALRGKSLSMDDWLRSEFLDTDWDDAQWEREMDKLFGEAYYAQGEYELTDGSDDAGVTNGTKKRGIRKPKWDDDIDIKDLVPNFEDDSNADKAAFMLSDDELLGDQGTSENGGEAGPGELSIPKKSNTKKDRLQERQKQKSEARRERRIIEEMVDEKLEEDGTLGSRSGRAAVFRYRDTSPTTFGLTPREILLAEDNQLNQYVGLKKIAAFRDPDKKKKDKKKLSKKARLRQWRKETFGNEEGPTLDARDVNIRSTADKATSTVAQGDANLNAPNDKKKQRRSRKRKAQAAEA